LVSCTKLTRGETLVVGTRCKKNTGAKTTVGGGKGIKTWKRNFGEKEDIPHGQSAGARGSG